MDLLFYWSGAVLWIAVLVAFISLFARVLWDGFRAFTVVVWGARICKENTGSYFFKGMVKSLFHNWVMLLGTRSGATTLHGELGYWNEWNDWKVYGENKQ